MTSAVSAAFETLCIHYGIEQADRVDFVGTDPVVDSRFRPGAASASALAAFAAAIARLWAFRGHGPQDISVDLRRAVIPGLRTSSHLTQNGQPMAVMPRTRVPPIAMQKTRDGRYFWFVNTVLYPDLFIKSLELLDCAYRPEAVATAVASKDGAALEDLFASAGLPGVFARTEREWAAHPQGALLKRAGPVSVSKIADTRPVPLPPGPRPLSGIRVFDASHVLAGPVAARCLAEHGADVLHVSPPHEVEPPTIAIDTGPGRRCAHLDFDRPSEAKQARTLAAGADVFITSWRRGAMERHGLGPADLAQSPGGMIYVTISAYGSEGIWADRKGYDPVGQVVSGLALGESTDGSPRIAPTMTLNDYLSAYLAAAGVAAALLRRAREGGSYHVQTSLTQASMWLLGLGRLPASEVQHGPNNFTVDPAHMMQTESPFGRLAYPAPIAWMSETPPRWNGPPMPYGSSLPTWLD